MEENNKNGHCPHCQVSDETIQNLKNSAQNSKKAEHDFKKQQKGGDRLGLVRAQKVKKIIFIGLILVLVAGGAVWGLANYKPASSSDKPKITVYYSSTCSCCKEYITYLRAKGFQVDAKQTENALSVKEKYGISSDIEGCHTSVVGDYFVEGMVPAEAISKLLEEKPDIKGIALPGMPNNAPGMPGYNIKGLKVYGVSDKGTSEFISF